MAQRRLKYYTHRGKGTHPASLAGHLARGLLLPLIIVVVAVIGGTGASLIPSVYHVQLLPLLIALGESFLRLFVSYLLALLIGVPLGLLAETNRHVEAFLLPIFDVFESMPVLAFFPVVILFFLHSGWLEGASLFIIFFSMVWNIPFSVVGGLKVIPSDVKAVGKVFELSRWQRLTKITLPALVPPIITGSILSMADGWNVLIVAEALHAYAPATSDAPDLNGIGSALVHASSAGDTVTMLVAMGMLVIAIASVNLFVWQPLLARSEQFKFE